MTFQTAATKPVPHPITSLILDIRLDPPTRGLPFHRPGDVLRGVVALVNENLEGVRDVKAKVHVESVSLKLFWESRELHPFSSRGCDPAMSWGDS